MQTNATITIRRVSEGKDAITGYPAKSEAVILSEISCLYASTQAPRFIQQSGQLSFDQPKDSLMIFADVGPLIREGDTATVTTRGYTREFIVQSAQPVVGITLKFWKLDLKATGDLAELQVTIDYLLWDDGDAILWDDGDKVVWQ